MRCLCVSILSLLVALPVNGENGAVARSVLEPADIFEIELANDPRISPDGSRIVYVRSGFDKMTDRGRQELWMLDVESGAQRPLLPSGQNGSSPRWSPDGQRLLFLSADDDGRSQIFLRFMDTGQVAQLTHLQRTPSGLSWSPDGRFLAFSMFVAKTSPPMARMPPKPEGAEWAPEAWSTERLVYRADGRGLLERGFNHLFLLPVDGGTPRHGLDCRWHRRRPAGLSGAHPPDRLVAVRSAPPGPGGPRRGLRRLRGGGDASQRRAGG